MWKRDSTSEALEKVCVGCRTGLAMSRILSSEEYQLLRSMADVIPGGVWQVLEEDDFVKVVEERCQSCLKYSGLFACSCVA